jgi:hypothetical protein
VGIVKLALTKILSEDGIYYEDWDAFLPTCLMGLRFLDHKTLGYSPFLVCHGTIPRIPLQHYQELPHSEWDDREWKIDDLIATVDYIRENVLQQLKAADVKGKESYDKRFKKF